MMEQKVNPLKIVFWTLAKKYFQFIVAIFHKKLDAIETGKF